MFTRASARQGAGVIALVAVAALLTSCGDEDPAAGPPRVIAVPADAPTITEAVGRARSGDLVLLSPGRYTESVTISTPGITLRGTDRNTVVIDGEGLRPQGVLVIADGVRVENLTVTAHTFNGVLVTGQHDGTTATAHNVDGYQTLDPAKFPPIQGFSIDHVTATNNGLYGLYAFNSQHGVISNSYAAGSADSGIYVGQCRECDILVTGNVAERNAIGFENANASDSLVVTGNRFSNNRVGLTLISNYQEAFQPQQGATVVGNLITGNAEPQSPAQADGGFGVGIGIAGGQNNVVRANLITGNPLAGVLIRGTEDIAATGNSLTDNAFGDNGVDLADTSAARSPASGTCLTGNGELTLLPPTLEPEGCSGQVAGADPADLPVVTVPPGISFLKVAAGPAQPNRDGDPAVLPAPLPAVVDLPNLSLTIPQADLFADRVLGR